MAMKTTKQFKQELESKKPSQFTVLSEYIGANEKIYIECKICGHKWWPKATAILNVSGCPECAKKINSQVIRMAKLKNSKTFAEMFPDIAQEWMYALDNKTLSPNDVSKKSHIMVRWRCHVCGHEWNASVLNRANEHGCPMCTGKKKRTQQEFTNDVEEVSPNKFNFLGEYKSASDFIETECKKCGYIWFPIARVLLNGCGCPICAFRQTESKLQRKVREHLEKKNDCIINHERDCSLVCINPKTNRQLPYDNEIIFNNCKLIIETNGVQHYKLGIFISEQEELDELQWRDQFKKEYAINNGYYYLVIPYWTEKDESYKQLIDDKINEILNKERN